MDNKIEHDSFESFRHGLVLSKLWLCEELEKVLDHKQKYNLNILGSWTNLICFMLFIRNSNLYTEAHAYDNNESAHKLAHLINDTWNFENPKIYYHLCDINKTEFVTNSNYNIFINCSVEHLVSRDWYNSIPENSIVVIQSTNVEEPNEPWFITDPVKNIEMLKERYPLMPLYTGTKNISYNHLSYERYMIIGIK